MSEARRKTTSITSHSPLPIFKKWLSDSGIVRRTNSLTLFTFNSQPTTTILNQTQKNIVDDYFAHIEKFLDNFFDSLAKNKLADPQKLQKTAGVILSLAISPKVSRDPFIQEINKYYGQLPKIPCALEEIYQLTHRDIPADSQLAISVTDARLYDTKHYDAGQIKEATSVYLASLIANWLAKTIPNIKHCVSAYLKQNENHHLLASSSPQKHTP